MLLTEQHRSEDTMDAGITDIASYLAARIPTGSDTPEGARDDWRTTLYNARSTQAMKPLTELVRRSVPDDDEAVALCESLQKR
jgi:hypothetical protein